MSDAITSALDIAPAGWRKDRLKDVVPRIVGGGTPASSDPEFWADGDILWITPTDFSKQNGSVEIFDSERKITRAGLNACAAGLLPKGTVIMASRATIGTARLAGAELATNQGFVSFVCDERTLHNRFLYYTIEAYLGGYFAAIAPGTTFAEISRGKVKQEAIGFPPFKEQERIAAYLDASRAAVDAAIAAKRRQLETLDALRKSTIQRVVTRGLNENAKFESTGSAWLESVPRGWSLVCLKRIAEIQGGLTLGKTYEGPLVERPYLRVGNVQDGHLDLEDVSMIEVPADVAADVELRRGDVLMTEGGDLDKLGRGYLWDGEIEGCLHQNHIFAVRCFLHKLLPKFLTYVTASRYGRDYFEATGKKTTNLACTNATKVGALPIPLPTLEEQKQLVGFLDSTLGEMKRLAARIERQIETLLAYRKSLIHECVTGQLRVTDSDVATIQQCKLQKQLD